MSSSPSITPPPWSPRGASARLCALGTVALLVALALAGCGEDKVVVRNLFLEVSSEAPASGRLESLRILFQKGDARYPTNVSEAAFNPALGALDPVARPVLLSVTYDGATFGDGRDVTVLVVGRSGTTPVTRFEGRMDLDAEQIVKVHMVALPGGCDDDRDGFLDCGVSGCCEGGSVFGDCVGTNAAANPWAIEASCEPCADEVDQDCKGGDQPCVDGDGDRIADCAEETCGKDDPRSGPGLPEICDTKDNDCDGQSDEGLSFRYRGQTLDKGDACGQGACAGGTVECAADGGLRCSTDGRAGTEICGNTIDDDCDGRVDEGCQVGDFDGDGFLVAEDCNDFDAGAYPGRTGEPCCPLAAQGDPTAQRACDLNCDGNVSFCEGGDADGDGVTVAEGDCNDGDAMVAPGKPEKCGDAIDQDCSAGDLSCTGLVDADGDGWSASVDCADADGAVRPDAVEICNGLDDDCDGAVDEGDPGGGGQCGETDVGACSFGFEHCQNSAGVFGQVACVGSIEPEAGDVCDGRDEDCDGETDEGFTWEGHAIGQACDGVGACGVGVVECAVGRTDRATCSTNPDGSASGATTEVCDAVDNDCDGETNEGLDDVAESTCSKLGVCGANLDKIVATCTLEGAWECDYAAVPGYQAGAELTCDALDNDCDGAFDEDLTFTEPGGAVRPFGAGCDGADADLCQNGVVACDPANNRRTLCSETGAARVELCDGADNDCDGETDEDFRDTAANRVKLTGALFADDNGAFLGDTCGAGACGAGVVVCGTTETLKCSTDPRSAATPNPPADVCDGLDNDCDGVADENFIAGGTVKLQNALATADNGKVLGAACGAGECSGGTVVCKTPEALGCSSDADAYTTNFAGQTVLREDTCNGKDDNCNGTTDDAFVTTSGSNRKPLAGALYASDNGKIKGASCGIGECLKNPSTGASSPGVVQCSADGSKLECSSDTRATTETCDNLDNDCDGTDDDPFRSATEKPLAGALYSADNGKTKDAVCGTGACASGKVVCAADKTKLVCNSDNRASTDVCDATDNDCDGSKDEGYLYEGLAIGATCDGVGGCGIGVVACAIGVNDRATCSTNPDGPTSQAGTETCDGQDNDCDLQVDEGFTYDGQPIGATCDGVGECGTGTVECLATGGAGCSTDPGGSAHVSSPETCDNKDNDCNGQTDDGIAATPTSCGVGACAATGQTTCLAGVPGDSCTPGTAAGSDATCDGVDDDCSGAADEDYVSVTTTCGVGVCAGNEGSTSCVGGDVESDCDPFEGATTEVCNGLDDDCNGVSDNGFANYDGDAFGDACDDDDDNDGVLDGADACDNSPLGFVSSTVTDYDGDGCKDGGTGAEDDDDDGDGILDAADKCDPDALEGDGALQSEKGWTSSVGAPGVPGTDYDADGCKDEDGSDGDTDDEDDDDDGDGLADGADKCDPDDGGVGDGVLASEKGWLSSVGTDTPGTDYDADGCKDEDGADADTDDEDDDDDNDGVGDATDKCDPDVLGGDAALMSEKGWTSDLGAGSPGNDYDGDGCKDEDGGDADADDEDDDDDGDGIVDATDACDPDDGGTGDGVASSERGWTSSVGTDTPGTDYDADGCKDEDGNDTDLEGEDDDDDGDGVDDGDDSCDPDDGGVGDGVLMSQKGWTSDLGTGSPGNDYDGDGCRDEHAEDGDDDGDGIGDGADLCDPDPDGPSGDEGADASQKDWTSTVGTSSPGTDYDADGCKDDSAEDLDDDDDLILDDEDKCDPDALTAPDGAAMSEKDWESDFGVGSPGVDYDNDGCRDAAAEDDDDDNDKVVDATDLCDPDGLAAPDGVLASQKSWSSNGTTDYDGDGCQDVHAEDGDDDNDGLADAADKCDPDVLEGDPNTQSERGAPLGTFTSDTATDWDGDGCKDDDDEDGDDDGDGVLDVSDKCDPDALGGGDGALQSEKGWISTTLVDGAPGTDYDGDGCKDEDGNDVGDDDEDDDDDNDGVADTADKCDPDARPDPDGVLTSQRGPTLGTFTSTPETDQDGDGCKDDGEDSDDDNDGVADGSDNCPVDANPGQEDSDDPDDGIGDACQDSDGDGVLDYGGADYCATGETTGCRDNCPDDANPDQMDANGNTVGDVCETCTPEYDLDDDGICYFGATGICTGGDTTRCNDNCPVDSNASQADTNSNGVGDACDPCTTTPVSLKEPHEVCGDCLDNDCAGGTDDAGCAYRRIIGIETSVSGVDAGHSLALTLDHKFLVDGGNSTASGNDVRIYYRNPATGVFTEIDRVLDPESSWNTATTKIWFKAQADINAHVPSGDEVNTDYYLFTNVTGEPKANEQNVFHFADFFDRTMADGTKVGPDTTIDSPPIDAWSETEGGGSLAVAATAGAASGRSLTFTTRGMDEDMRPVAFRQFSAITAGRWLWRTRWNWARTAADNGYALVAQLGNTTSTTFATAPTGTAYPSSGVGPNVVWGRNMWGFANSGVGDLAATNGTTITNGTTSGTPVIDEYDGSSQVAVLFDIDNDNFAIAGDGQSFSNAIAFNNALSQINAIRLISHNMDNDEFSPKQFDYVMIQRLVPSGEAEPLLYVGVDEPVGPACGVDGSALGRWYLDDDRDDVLGTAATTLKDSSPDPLDLTRHPIGGYPGLGSFAMQHGLYWSAASSKGVAAVDYEATKLVAASPAGLDGARTATIELVAELYDTATETFLVNFQRDTGERPLALSISTPAKGVNILTLYVNNVVAAQWSADVVGMVRVLFTIVLDTTQETAADRVKIYRDGERLTWTNSATPPVRDTALDFTDPGALLLGNTGIESTSSPYGILYYTAVYPGALSDGQIQTNANVLRADDDRR